MGGCGPHTWPRDAHASSCLWQEDAGHGKHGSAAVKHLSLHVPTGRRRKGFRVGVGGGAGRGGAGGRRMMHTGRGRRIAQPQTANTHKRYLTTSAWPVPLQDAGDQIQNQLAGCHPGSWGQQSRGTRGRHAWPARTTSISNRLLPEAAAWRAGPGANLLTIRLTLLALQESIHVLAEVACEETRVIKTSLQAPTQP